MKNSVSHDDIWCFDLTSRTWSCPEVVPLCRGDSCRSRDASMGHHGHGLGSNSINDGDDDDDNSSDGDDDGDDDDEESSDDDIMVDDELELDNSLILDRGGHTLTAVSPSRFIVFGGQNRHVVLNDVIVFDWEVIPAGDLPETVRLTWHRPAVRGLLPPKRSQHLAFAYNKSLYILFGHDGHGRMLGDIWSLNCSNSNSNSGWSWRQERASGACVPDPAGASSATLINGRDLYVFGGRIRNNLFTNALRVLDVDTMVWRRAVQTKGHSPSPRAAHSATLIGEHKLAIIGGSSGDERMDDVHILDLHTLTWSCPSVSLSSQWMRDALSGGSSSGTLRATAAGAAQGAAGQRLGPGPHSVHTAVPLENPCDEEGLILFGGFDGTRCFSDAYFLTVERPAR